MARIAGAVANPSESCDSRLCHMTLHAELRDALVAARNRGGGWAYVRGKASRLEPTCWALLALAQANGLPPDVGALSSWPRQGPWLVDAAGVPPNYAFNALAALTMLAGSTAPAAEPVVSALMNAKGVPLAANDLLRQDGSLQAWPWIEGTFSWVEPTSWCLLLLKRRRARGGLPGADERIDVGERMLFDRVCAVGGWNYGSSNVYGQELLPYVPTTALGLMALQDRRAHPVVVRSLTRLQQDLASERSAVALALSAICLHLFEVSTDAVVRELEAHAGELLSHRRTDDNTLGLAMALYALTIDSGSVSPFGLST